MHQSGKDHALTIGDQQQVVPITFLGETEQQIRERLGGSTGKPVAIRISPAESSDVEGHALDSTSVSLNLLLEGDDTAGHAISVRFPTAEDAARFRRNVLVAGVLAGTIVIGSAGAIAMTSQPPMTAPVDQSRAYQQPGADVVSPVTGINPATGKPWRAGFQERSDGEVTGGATLPAFARPAGRGPLESVE